MHPATDPAQVRMDQLALDRREDTVAQLAKALTEEVERVREHLDRANTERQRLAEEVAEARAAIRAARKEIVEEIAEAIEASIVQTPEERYANCTCLAGVECHPHACHRAMNGVTSRADEDTWLVTIGPGVWHALDPLIRADAARIARQLAAPATQGDEVGGRRG